MNSADHSIGHIDVAIRRRFGLYPLGANPKVVGQVWESLGDKNYGEKLVNLMTILNKELATGNEFEAQPEQQVGHSYFLPSQGSSVKNARVQVALKWEFQVQPLLREYDQILNLKSSVLHKFFKPLEECLDRNE